MFSAQSGLHPRLLVSVRSDIEAAAAIEGGADILDVKDPDRGSLGCPDPSVLKAICGVASLESDRPSLPITTALGECVDWNGSTPFELPDRVLLAKLGLSGLGENPHWINDWLSVRRNFEAQRGAAVTWAAVAYVDEVEACSPAIDDVADAALETGCAGLLVDTWSKSSGRLFDHISEKQLVELADRMHSAGRFIAAAGRLSLKDVGRLATLPIDVIAVRSAVCEKSDRRSAVTAGRVAACRAAMYASERRLSGAY